MDAWMPVERPMSLIVEHGSTRTFYGSMAQIAEDIGIEYDAVKMHVFRRRHGKDPISTDAQGRQVKIFESRGGTP